MWSHGSLECSKSPKFGRVIVVYVWPVKFTKFPHSPNTSLVIIACLPTYLTYTYRMKGRELFTIKWYRIASCMGKQTGTYLIYILATINSPWIILIVCVWQYQKFFSDLSDILAITVSYLVNLDPVWLAHNLLYFYTRTMPNVLLCSVHLGITKCNAW